MSNGSDYSGGGAAYDPDAPLPKWHQNMELATICVCNSLTLLLIVARVAIRRHRLKRFRKDDIWLMVAGGILVVPYWVCQLGTNRYGSGLHAANVPDSWLIPFWKFETGWVGYYIVLSMIKVSVCVCLLDILPHSFRAFRRCVFALCAVIICLGIAESLVWIFQCRPFLSNFVYDVGATYCIHIDNARFAWVGISIPIDLAIISIPFAIINQIRLKTHERYVLFFVFGANLIGTATSIFGIYGIWLNRTSNAFTDLAYSESIYIMTNDIEIFMYAVGASATVFSRYFVSKVAAYSGRPTTSDQNSEHVSWRMKMATTFSGVHHLPSPWAGNTDTSHPPRKIALASRSGSTLTGTPTFQNMYEKKLGGENSDSFLEEPPTLRDVGGLGGDWSNEGSSRGKRPEWKESNAPSDSDAESQRHENMGWRNAHQSWYGNRPKSTSVPVWEWARK